MIYQLYNTQQAKDVLTHIWPLIKEKLNLGKQIRLEVKTPTRSLRQNDMFHSIIHQIYVQMKSVNCEWSADDWKRLLIDQWAHETNRRIGRVTPSLDGQRLVQLGMQTHKFSVDESSEFIEWLIAWCVDKTIEI